MALMQWNPFREMDDLLSNFQRGIGTGLARSNGEAWAPLVDISETPKEYTVRAELPGVKKEDVKIQIANGVLTLSGERRFEKEDKSETHHRIERSYGAYSRSFVMPEDVLEDKIGADCKEGIVTVHLPKSEVPKTATKEIRIA